MGSTISRIEREFILNSVCDNAIPLKLSGYKVKASGTLETVDDDFIIISSEEGVEELFPVGSEVRVYFSYYGHVMTFVTHVSGILDGNLKADVPESIHKNLTRKYERVVPPDGVSISFEQRGAKIALSFPRTEEYDPVDIPEYTEGYDPGNIQGLVAAFREKVKDKVSENTVTMYRGRPPKGLEETLICQTGKIFYIPSTLGNLPENDYELDGRIVTRALLLRSERIGVNEEVLQDRLPVLLAEKREKGIIAEIFCPIIYHEYAVGFIHLVQSGRKDKVFDRALLDETYQFSKILAYALKISGYFKETIPEKSEYDGEILDMSASGLLFANNSEALEKSLLLYSDIDVQFRFGPRSMRIGARIMRKFSGNSVNYFGIQFMEIKPEDFRFLFDFVYGRDVTSEEEELWEGGSDPPKLSFD